MHRIKERNAEGFPCSQILQQTQSSRSYTVFKNISMLDKSDSNLLKSYRRIVNLHLTYITFTGLWHLKPSTSRILLAAYNVYKIIIVATVFIFTLTLFADICTNFDDLSIVTDDGCIFAGIFVVFFKMSNFLRNHRKIARIVDDTFGSVNDLFRSTNENVDKIMQHYLLRDKVSAYGFTTIGLFLAIALVILVPTEEGELPIRARYPFDTSKSPWHEVAFLVQACSVFAGIIAIIGMDGLQLNLCNIVTVQFRVLTIHFERCSTKFRNKTNSLEDARENSRNVHWSYVNQFKACLRHQQRLIEIVSQLNDTFSSSIFAQVCASSFMICLTGFQAVVIMGESSDTLKFSIYLCAALSQLLILCWVGNDLMFESTAIADGQWLSNWDQESSSAVARLLIISSMFSKRPLKLKAGKFFTMSLETFITILRGSYSFFALLNNVHTANQRHDFNDPSVSSGTRGEF